MIRHDSSRFAQWLAAVLVVTALAGGSCGGHPSASKNPVVLELGVGPVFRFAAFGDTRFHDPSDLETSNPYARRALVAKIDQEKPAFVSIGGDIVYTGDDVKDWQTWDSETSLWRDHKLVVYPALGNHDVKGNLEKALGNYFARFPELKECRYYSVRMGNTLMLVLDTDMEELPGPQGDWLRTEIDHLAPNLDFVFLVFHHPPYTSSSDSKTYGGGHSARPSEQALAAFLEERQKHVRARFVVFTGHVHNYERHEHGGITYFVTGGGGAHAYPILRQPDDLYKDPGINYHYLLGEVDHRRLTVTMNKLEFKDGHEVWSKPDSVTLTAPAAAAAAD